jgi:hypothetical protein
MPIELSLWLTDETGQEQQVLVQTNPFTIGRHEANDLVLARPGLSRRHAVLTRFGNEVQLSDCHSQNGTFVNGQQLASAVQLKDGDVISLGHICELQVQYRKQEEPATRPPVSPPVANRAAAGSINQTLPAVLPSSRRASGQWAFHFSPLAWTITAIITILGTATAWLLHHSFSRTSVPPPQKVQPTQPPIFVPPSPEPSPFASVPGSIAALTLNIEKMAIRVVQKISLDQTYAFRPHVLADLQQRCEKYANPSLAKALRQFHERGQELARQAKTLHLNPYLLSYLALAETNGGQNGEPVEIARRAVPRLHSLRVELGGDTGDSSLLILAAYRAPLKLAAIKNAQTERNIWSLHKRGAISTESYDFVLRVLAYGVLAQNPKSFSLDAVALVF